MIKGFYFNEDPETPEANTAWALDDIASFREYLEDNVEPNAVIQFVYKEFTEDEWKACELRGKYFGGEELTTEESKWLEEFEGKANGNI